MHIGKPAVVASDRIGALIEAVVILMGFEIRKRALPRPAVITG